MQRSTSPANRALKFVFNSAVDFDELGPVDPYVDLILGLTRRDEESLWIPNRRKGGWDASHPERHTELMTSVDPHRLSSIVRTSIGSASVPSSAMT